MPTIRLALRESEDNIFHCKNAVYVTHAIICAPRRIYKLPTQTSRVKQELPPSSVFRRNTYSIALKSPSRQHRSSEVSDISRGADPADVPPVNRDVVIAGTGQQTRPQMPRVPWTTSRYQSSCGGSIISRHSLVMGSDYLGKLLISLGKGPEGYVGC